MSIWGRSVSGALMILVIIIIRALAINKLPKKVFMVLWGVVLTRLLVPYYIPSSLSVYSLVGRMTAHQELQNAVSLVYTGAVTGIPNTQTAELMGSEDAFFAAEIPTIAVEPWKVVWLVGFVGVAGFFLISYIRCRREFREAIPVRGEVVENWLKAHPLRRTISICCSDRISAPLTFGILHPVILVPKTTPWSDRECVKYVLEHEFMHIKCFDAVIKLVLTAALCVHWFNPVVWGMYILANRDIELSCDEAVLRLFGENTKSVYARTLIRMEEANSGLRPLCNNFSKNAIEERIEAIMKTKKYKFQALVIAGALVICVTVGFATSAKTVAADSAGKGITWDDMTLEEFEKVSQGLDVEWWTAEEYSEWLEQEKVDLQEIVGEQGWNPTDGWYTWTQEMVDEAIARYEQELVDIQNGMKISKPIGSGDTRYQFAYDPDAFDSMVEGEDISYCEPFDSMVEGEDIDYCEQFESMVEGEDISYCEPFDSMAEGEDISYCEQEVLQQETIAFGVFQSDVFASESFDNGIWFMTEIDRYAPFGVTFIKNGDFGNLYYNGKLVEVLVDHSPDGIYTTFKSSDQGEIKIQAVYDSEGNLSGMEEIGG